MSPLFLRCPELRSHIDCDAETGPSLKALILIGLLHSQRSRVGLEAVYHQALSGRLAPDVRRALEAAWHMGVIEPSASTSLASSKQVASIEPKEDTPADLWNIGMEV